jgi:ABC-type branched-subunit amino acid transport system ATPase component
VSRFLGANIRAVFVHALKVQFSASAERLRAAAILLAEQNMHFCLRIAQEAFVVDKRKVVPRQDTAGRPK